MKTFKLMNLLMAICALFLIPACGDDDANPSLCGANFQFQTELAAESAALSSAAATYANDPTSENCNAYKAAATAYLDAAADLEDCAVLSGQGTEFNQAIADAQASVDALQC